jgi:bifunctional DNA-binding transcriptional regulator/antitoxin component of YhaV-PrlF toxin-antitoxin module
MSVISSKHQLTLPVEVMRAAGFVPGDDVQVVSPAPGRIEIVQTDALIARYAGSMPGVYGEDHLKKLRAEWE